MGSLTFSSDDTLVSTFAAGCVGLRSWRSSIVLSAVARLGRGGAARGAAG